MDTSLGITAAEIIDALTTSSREPEDAKTVNELVDEHGVCKTTMMEALRKLQKEQRLIVHQVMRVGIDGRRRPVPAYTVLPKRKDRK
jgi:hypothetical protein